MKNINFVNFSRLLRLVSTVYIVALAGCALVGPDYKKPEVPVDENFANAIQEGLTTANTEAAWWKGFNDEKLNRYIEAAISANHDLRIATANLLGARALQVQVGYDRFPTVTAAASYTKERAAQDATPPGSSRNSGLFQAGFDAFWELDFFGRVRRNIEAAIADVEAAEASRRDVMVSLIAEVARNYFELRGEQNQLQVARDNAKNQQETLDLTLALLEGGRGTELDTANARQQLNTTLATIPLLEASVRRTIYRLSVLTGRQPQALVAELDEPLPLPEYSGPAALGHPEDLLRRRPDIRVAERSLAAATARVGVAVADLFPRVTFNGSIGYEAHTLSGLGSAGSDTYSIIPSISWAAFNLGRVRAGIRAADARTEANLAFYEKTVLTALEETEDALVTFGRERVRRDYLRAAAAASREAAALSRQRYQEGIATFLTELDAERRLLDTEQQLAQSETSTATALVAVYKALGGGWEIEQPLAAQ
jgi:multidrug efflux system outer membrane protein